MFPEFWFEGNQYFDWVKSEHDLQKVFKSYSNTLEPFEVLDKARSKKYHDKLDINEVIERARKPEFGLRSEHTGEKTLRQFLIEENVDLIYLPIKSIYK